MTLKLRPPEQSGGLNFYISLKHFLFLSFSFCWMSCSAQTDFFTLQNLQRLFNSSAEEIKLKLDSLGYKSTIGSSKSLLYTNGYWSENGETILEEFCNSTNSHCIGFLMKARTKEILLLDVSIFSPIKTDSYPAYTLIHSAEKNKVYTDRDKTFVLIIYPGLNPGQTVISFNKKGTSMANFYLKTQKKKL